MVSIPLINNLLYEDVFEDDQESNHSSVSGHSSSHRPSTVQRRGILPSAYDITPLDPDCLEAQARESYKIHQSPSAYAVSAINSLTNVSRLYFVKLPITHFDKTDLVRKKFFLNGPHNYSIQTESGVPLFRVTHRNEFRIGYRHEEVDKVKVIKTHRIFSARESYVVDADGYLVIHYLRSILANHSDNHKVMLGGTQIAKVASTNTNRLTFHVLSEMPDDDFNYRLSSKQLKLFTCSQQNPTFDIINRRRKEPVVIGHIHSKWTENYGVLGIQFPINLSPETKVSLMMGALLVNEFWETD